MVFNEKIYIINRKGEKIMSFSSDLKEELLNQKVWDNKSGMKQEEQIDRVCVRESFIKTGFINDPNKDYHLEILFKTVDKAEEIQKILKKYNINSKIITKNKGYMVYIKDGEEISKFLAFVGANTSVLKFEEIRVIKETKNNINRLVNCETANLNKTINAAVMQMEDIKLIRKCNKFDDLPKMLKEIIVLREENPELSLEQLGQILEIPIGKSGVNHRLKKIHEIAEELRK